MKKINMHIQDDLLALIREYKQKTGISMSELIRRAVMAFIRKD